jgi:hypothetical protein
MSWLSSQMLSHTSGLSHLEDEEIMGYYQAIGDPRGTLIMRYFMSEDEEVRAKALPEVQYLLNTLVITQYCLLGTGLLIELDR